MNREDLSYAAGAVDCDGAIGITKALNGGRKGNPRYTMFVDVTNTNENLIKWFIDEFEGHKYISHHGNDKNKKSWRWRVCSLKAAEFIRLILPYLKIKRDRAELALRFMEWVSSDRKRKPKAYYDNQDIFYQVMKILNRRGVQDN